MMNDSPRHIPLQKTYFSFPESIPLSIKIIPPSAGNKTKCVAWADVPGMEGLRERIAKDAPAIVPVNGS